MEPKQQAPYPLRMPSSLRVEYERRAKKSGRSLNSEICTALTEIDTLRVELAELREEAEAARERSVMTQAVSARMEERLLPRELENAIDQVRAPSEAFAQTVERVIRAGLDPTRPPPVVLHIHPDVHWEAFRTIGSLPIEDDVPVEVHKLDRLELSEHRRLTNRRERLAYLVERQNSIKNPWPVRPTSRQELLARAKTYEREAEIWRNIAAIDPSPSETSASPIDHGESNY